VVRESWASFGEWRRRVGDELSMLPETLRGFREGTANFQVIAERLAKATERLEELGELYAATGAVDAIRRMNDAASALQRQMAAVKASTPGLDRLGSALDDFNRTVASLADLNPFLRRPPATPRS
jgi:hypothetical protein